MSPDQYILADVLRHNLKVVFCGMAVSLRSAKLHAYYAGIGNKFWKTLWDIGLTPEKIKAHDFYSVLNYGIGLTDVVKSQSGADSHIPVTTREVVVLRAKIDLYAPKILAFNGKRAAQEVIGHPVDWGLQPDRIARSEVYVLPSTSLAATGFWNISYWVELGQAVKAL